MADGAFVAELKACLPPGLALIERPTHINDPAFATEAAKTLIRLMETHTALVGARSPWHAVTPAGSSSTGCAPRSPAAAPLVMTGAGSGICAKFIERGGVDILGVYNTGYFRMQGYGSLAGHAADRRLQ